MEQLSLTATSLITGSKEKEKKTGNIFFFKCFPTEILDQHLSDRRPHRFTQRSSGLEFPASQKGFSQNTLQPKTP
jgi:hypothetical protein